jgi:hypothetical protein
VREKNELKFAGFGAAFIDVRVNISIHSARAEISSAIVFFAHGPNTGVQKV